MSQYTDSLIEKAKREKERQTEQSLSMKDASGGMEFEMELGNSVSDGDFAEDYFNDAATSSTKLDDIEESVEEVVEEEPNVLPPIKNKRRLQKAVSIAHDIPIDENRLFDDFLATVDTPVQQTAVNTLSDTGNNVSDYTVDDYIPVQTSPIIEINKDDLIDELVNREINRSVQYNNQTEKAVVQQYLASQELINSNNVTYAMPQNMAQAIDTSYERQAVIEAIDITDITSPKEHHIFLAEELQGDSSMSVETAINLLNINIDTLMVENDKIIHTLMSEKQITESDARNELIKDVDFMKREEMINSFTEAILEVKQTGKVSDTVSTLARGSAISENDDTNRDKTNATELVTKSVADTTKEKIETEQQKAEFKEQNLHHFVAVANEVIIRTAEHGGQKIISYARDNVINSDVNAKAGSDEIKKIVTPLVEATTIAGMASSASAYKDKINSIGKAGELTEKAISSGKMNAEDLLLSKSDLKKKLKEAGVSSSDLKAIVGNKGTVSDLLKVRAELQGMAATGQMKLDDKLKDILNSKSFYHINKAEVGMLLQQYYRNSADDVIRNAFAKGSITGKSSSAFNKFLKNASKNEVSEVGLASIRLGKKVAEYSMANRLLSNKVTMSLKHCFKSMVSNITQSDRNFHLGSQQIRIVSRMATPVVKATWKVAIGSSKHGYKGLATQSARVVKKILVGTKKNGYKGIATTLVRNVIWSGKYIDKSMQQLTGHSIGQFINRTKAATLAAKKVVADKTKTAVTKAVTKVANTATGKAVVKTHNATVKNIKAANKKARETATKIAQSKAAKAARITAKKTGKVVSAPVRFGGKIAKGAKNVVGKIFSIANKIKKYVYIGVFGFLALYAVLVILIMGFQMVFSQNSDVIKSMIIANRQEFVSESIEEFVSQSEDIKQNAIDIGTGEPINPTVMNGHTISKYGHPDENGTWIDGYKIFYTDSSGNIIQDGANNVKDTLILSYTQMKKWTDNEEEARKIQQKYFNWLNPNSDPETMLENSKESDIYFCSSGCETLYYVCNDSAIVDNDSHSYMSHVSINAEHDAGVQFYSGIVTNSGGDYYIRTCNGHDNSYWDYCPDSSSPMCNNCIVNDDQIYECQGHYIYDYTDHGAKINGTPSGCNNYNTEYFCTGHSVDVCYGHKDVTIYIPIYTMDDAFAQEYSDAWKSSEQSWAWCLFNADWYQLYGIDPSGGNGFYVVSKLSDEDINSILANCGSISETRRNIVETALGSVGSIPYYYGGKPLSGDNVPFLTNRGVTGSKASSRDHVGRTVAGLDCFGWCQWVYWNATGSNILPEGTTYTTGVVYKLNKAGNLVKIPASELQPGDLGFMNGHCGLFVGVNENGQLLWCHCTGSANTVVVGVYNGFNKFYRLTTLD